MMAGKPILCVMDVGSSPVEEYGCGIMVKTEDVNQVVQSIEKLWRMSEEERRAMGERGKRAIRKYFTYDMLTHIFQTGELTVLAVCIDEDKLSEQYDMTKLNDRFQIAMNMIIENYYHFLNRFDGVGDICYESLPKNQNERIKKRYIGIKYTGTMFYPAKVINTRIKNLEFKNKKENVVGLQLADFIPNAIGRYILEKTYNNRKERNISMDVLQEKLYDGDIDKKEKFGLKIIP